MRRGGALEAFRARRLAMYASTKHFYPILYPAQW